LLVEPSGQRGLAHYVYGLGNALAARRHEVTLLTAIGHETAELTEAYRVMEVFARFRTDPIRLGRSLLTLSQERFDVVHFHGAIHPEVYAPFLWVVRRVLRCPIVYTAHDLLPLKGPLARGAIGPLLTGPLTRFVYRQASAVLVHAHENRERLLRRFSLRPETVHVIPFGNYCFMETLVDAEVSALGPEVRTALFFGIIVESKGLMDLIRAFRGVAARLPSSRLLIVGQPFEDCGPYRDEIERLGLRDRVVAEFRYVPLAEVPRYFRSADVVVLPYRDASQSAVLQVAYAFGRPVVATSVGGLRETVLHRQSGILVPPGDTRALTDALVEILSDDVIRLRMGAEARALARERHSWDRVVAMTEDIYTRAT